MLDAEYTSTAADGKVTTTHQIRTTGERTSFAGAQPVKLFTQVVSPALGISFDSYLDVVNGTLLNYGNVTYVAGKASTIILDPVLSNPVDMQPGQAVSSTYKTVNSTPGSNSATISTVTLTLTYQGRENVTTALGSFNACKFTTVATTKDSLGDVTNSSVDAYIAAEGPYRGQQLKSGTAETTKMTYTPK